MKITIQKNMKDDFDQTIRFGFVKYECCCDRVRGDHDYLPHDLALDMDKGTLMIDNSAGEYNTSFTDIKFCPYCGSKVEYIYLE